MTPPVIAFITRAVFALLLFANPLVTAAQAFVGGNGFYMRGDLRYRPGKVVIDTVSVIDPATGAEQFEAREDTTFPSYISNRKVYDIDEVSTPVIFSEAHESQHEYLLQQLTSIILSTQFYEYGASARLNLRNIIVDEKGRVIFYELFGMRGVTAENRVKPLSFPELAAQINKFMTELPPVKPATVDGKNVMAYSGIDLHHMKIEKVGKSLIFSYDGNVYPE